MKNGLYVIDTNVLVTANKSRTMKNEPKELHDCIRTCVDVLDSVKQTKQVVLDFDDEIFIEYINNLSLSGQPGQGDAFIKWLHQNRWSFPDSQRVKITKAGDSYTEFSDHPDLADFDISDRKFVATANAHDEKPPILQATDSKWWGWKDALEESGISVQFLCPKYIQTKYEKKMVTGE
ncbi:MAG: hypothetical protein LBU99_02300 [Spirochaetaceae bacterium]|jgi:hypothetical protein|nr:hypothetical protein [Spirochaetaceae bacterium]